MSNPETEPESAAEPADDSSTIDPSAPLCRHLPNKGMYVYTDGLSGGGHEGYDNSIYWCFKTMNSFGPDDEYVNRDECRCATRTCYQPI